MVEISKIVTPTVQFLNLDELVEESLTLDYQLLDGGKLDLILICTRKQKLKLDLLFDLSAVGAELKIYAIFILPKEAQVSINAIQHHKRAHTTSRLSVRSALLASSNFYFRGTVKIEPTAVNSDAAQENKNLVLTDSATVVSEPQIEVLNQQVQCKHGSSTAPIGIEELFYLESRGLSVELATKILTYAFLTEAILDYTIACENIEQSVEQMCSL